MRTLLTAAFLAIFASHARAQSIYYTVYSTASYSGACVSNTAPVEVDALGGALPNRTAVVVTVPKSAAGSVNCGFDVSVYTVSPTVSLPSPHYGIEIDYGSAPYMFQVGTYVKLFCLAQGTAGCVPVSIVQLSPYRQYNSRTIPGAP
jgi:hypothetical protein